MTGTIAAVCNIHQLTPARAYGFASGIDKRPITSPLRVEPLGAMGDHHGDKQHHGGFFKAVYAFARETRLALAALEHKTFPDGFFGENLVTVNQATDEAVVGEQWQVGTARLEATCPRIPCKTFAERMADKHWPKRFMAHGRCGSYFAVRQPGEIHAGDAIQVVARPEHGVTIGQLFRGVDVKGAAALLDWATSQRQVLYDSVVRQCLKVLERAGQPRSFDPALRSTGR